MQRRRKNRKVVKPQVKVQSAAVDMATGKAPANPVGVAETRVLQALGIFFSLLLVEGLLLAASVSEIMAGHAYCAVRTCLVCHSKIFFFLLQLLLLLT